MRIAALVPSHNEAESIAATIDALLAQERMPDLIVVISDNSTDDTLDIASKYAHPVIAVETTGNAHKKSGALNFAWRTYALDADIVICLDADTILPPNAIGDWEQEMIEDPALGGSSSKFTMQAPGLLSRLQKAEFSKWTDSSLRRGWTSVLAGTGCAIRNSVLHKVVFKNGTAGPWSYDSQVEDFFLTYQIRQMGYDCKVSPTVRAYTDSMKTVRALWGQRCKWQVGTVEDLTSIGFNKLTAFDWWQQAQGLFAALSRVLWAIVTLSIIALGQFHWNPIWTALPLLFVANDYKAARRIPHCDWKDIVLALALLPQEFFAWLRAAWFISSWFAVLKSKITGNRKDRWAAQYALEAK